MPTGKVSRVVKYGVKQLEEPQQKNVLVIDGASFVLNAVDVRVLSEELAALGYSALAVKLAFGGANHFERFRVYEDIANRIPTTLREGQRWVYLAEVTRSYDREPLSQMEGNVDTARAFHYLSPINAWHAGQAMLNGGPTLVETDGWQWTLMRHAMVNGFNAGLESRLVPESKIKPVDGRIHSGWSRSFKYDFEALLKEVQHPGPDAAVPPWLFTVREPRERAVWSAVDPRWIYFGVPSTAPEQLRYIRSFCKSTKAPCLVPNEPLIRNLKAAKYWRNRGHMTPNGAAIYSRWLADRVAKTGVLAK